MTIFHHLVPTNIPPKAAAKDTLSVEREIILQRLLNILLTTFSFGLPLVLLFWPEAIQSRETYIFVVALAGLLVVTILRNIPYFVRASIVILTLQMIGAIALLSYGFSSTGIIFLFGASVTANLLFNQRIGGTFTYLSFLILIIIGGLMVSGKIPQPPIISMANASSSVQWIIVGAAFLFMMFLIMRSIYAVFQGMNATMKTQEKLTHQLEDEQTSLERRVEERSLDLKRRLAQFEIASQIAREISNESSLENLLNRAVSLIRDRFDYYHVGVYLISDDNRFVVLRAATGDAGRLMLERNFRQKISEMGMVSQVVSRGEARIALDVSSDMMHYQNPLLPETRSEMTLPLRSAGKTIGALDVKSVLRNAFVQEDIEILQTIADQLAIAFEKARLIDRLRRSLEELDKSQGAMIQKAWRMHLKNARQQFSYRYQNSRIDHQVEETEQGAQAYVQGVPVIKTISDPVGKEKPVTVLALPIKLRNQVLGVVDIHFEGANISPDLISLIEGTVNRLAISLENARLLEEIQFRAERERLVSEVSSKVRTASDIDNVLRIAVQEIGRSLGVSEVSVQLRDRS